MSNNSYSVDEKASSRSAVKALIIASIAFALILINVGIALAQSNDAYIRAHAQGRLTSCKSNLKNIAIALEFYATDNGQYPPSLSVLTANSYIGTIPQCPSAGKDTYSASYTHSAKYFKIYCAGNAHKLLGLPPNRPAFNSEIGIYEN